MRKKILCLVMIAICFIPSLVFAESEKVKVYLFRGEGCPHCEDALEFFNGLSDEEKAKFDLVQYEVWYDESNGTLMAKVAASLGETATGVPYIIVGKKSFSGFDDETGDAILEKVNEMYENKDFTDIMDSITTSNSGNMIVLIGFVIVAIIIVGILDKVRKKM